MLNISKYWAIVAFMLGSTFAMGGLILHVSPPFQKQPGASISSSDFQSAVVPQHRYRSIADASYQASSPMSTKDKNLMIEEIWWNNEQLPNLCYQIENAGAAASSHYSIEIYRGGSEKAKMMFKTPLRRPLQAGQNIVACMAVPDVVRRERESILLVAVQKSP